MKGLGHRAGVPGLPCSLGACGAHIYGARRWLMRRNANAGPDRRVCATYSAAANRMHPASFVWISFRCLCLRRLRPTTRHECHGLRSSTVVTGAELVRSVAVVCRVPCVRFGRVSRHIAACPMAYAYVAYGNGIWHVVAYRV
jgi:hypothetical protein